jgi:hypothetical protein
MRRLPFFVLPMILILAAASVGTAAASSVPKPSPAHTPAMQGTTQTPNDDDDLVEVQLVVAGVAALVVVGLGSAAYFLRRRLGLTAYNPEEAGGGGHH